MSTFTFNGTTYDVAQFKKEMTVFAEMLARNARLLDPLPANVDLTEQEQTELQTQIGAPMVLPPWAQSSLWTAFVALHIGQLASRLRDLSHDTQPAALIQILSLIPDPKEELYFRRFLQTPQSRGIPNLVAKAFIRGIAWQRPSGPGYICLLLIHCLFWSDTKQGDDGKASIDAQIRKKLREKLDALIAEPHFKQLDKMQQVEMERLKGILGAVESMPEDYYLKSTREHLEGQVDGCANPECDDEANMVCARCKLVRYCGKECQAQHWKKAHKQRCYPAVIEQHPAAATA